MSDSDNNGGCLKVMGFLGLEGILVMLLIVGVVVFFVFGPTVTLTCFRQDTSDVLCQFSTRTFMLGGSIGGIPHVQRAVNEQECDGVGCKYRVVLETADGKRPLTKDYTSGSKADLVNKLNAFIADQSQTKIELTQSPDFSCLIPIGLIVIVSVVLIVIYRVRRRSVQQQ